MCTVAGYPNRLGMSELSKACTEYDAFSVEYTALLGSAIRIFHEEPLVYRLVADKIKGARVLDVPCGSGRYTELLTKWGASEVVGLDISAQMIELARKRMGSPSIRATFEVRDFRHPLVREVAEHKLKVPNMQGSFDLTLSPFLISYSTSRDDVLAFARNLFVSLRPGGRAVGIEDNPAQKMESFLAMRQYGFVKVAPTLTEGKRRAPREFECIPIHIYEDSDVARYLELLKQSETNRRRTYNPLEKPAIVIESYSVHRSTYEWAFREAGFTSFHWVIDTSIADAGVQLLTPDYWRAYVSDPPIIAWVAEKSPPMLVSKL